ncbi:MAG TPA: immunoglobulin-like domain-containing protein, partial [Ilumatobacter sp.]
MVTTGIVTAVRFSSFYIQTPDGEQDGDVNTSEGILVFRSPGGVAVGDLVKVSGTIVEFVPGADPDSPPITEFPNTSFVTVLSHGHPLPAPATLLPSFTSPAGNFEQLERFEGMRVTADITAVTGTASFRRLDADEINATSTSNGEFFAVLTGVARPMREPGLDPTQPSPAMPCCIPRFDGNPERLRVDSDGQTGAQKIEIVAGQTIAGLTGVLDYGFRSYTIVPDVSPWTPAGIGEAQPIPAPGVNEFTVASFNMQRFFDTLDDPGVDDLVLTAAAFEKRLSKASLAIRNILRTPDILGVEEIDNLATLQTLAARINADAVAAGQPNPLYEAHLVEGNDPGGIDVGVLVKTARVDVVDVTQVGKDTTWVQPDGDERLLNDRPPLVLEAAIRADGAIPYAVTVIVNHLRSLSGIDGSDGVRIRAKRRAQAEFLANYIQSRQATDPSERIISVGDYNAFQVNDGYVDMIGTIKGQPTPPDQVMLASLDLVNPDLVALVEALNAEQRYSFVFDGTAQALDHVLVTQPAFRRLSRFVYARFNADFPESVRNDATRPERNSDHDAPVAYFSLPGAPIVTLNGPNPMTVEAMTTFTDPGAVATDDELGTWAVQGVGTVDTTTVGSYQLTYTATNGFLTTTVTRTVNVVDTTPPVVLLNGDASMTIELGSPFVDPGAMASDTRAGDLTSSIVVSGAVNVNVVSVYTLIYSVTDGYNSAS